MAASRTVPFRHEFNIASHKPFGLNDNLSRTESKETPVNVTSLKNVKRKHESFNIADMALKTRVKDRHGTLSDIGRNAARRTQSFGVSDWSRHSRDRDDTDVFSETRAKCDETKSPTATMKNIDSVIITDSDTSLISQSDFSETNDYIKALKVKHQITDSTPKHETFGSPTNIRRKLRSFEILPNYKRSNKTSNINQVEELDGGKTKDDVVSETDFSMLDDYTDPENDFEAQLSDDDDTDIISPAINNYICKDRTSEKAQVRHGRHHPKFYVGNKTEIGNVSPEIRGTRVLDKAVIICSNGEAFRKKYGHQTDGSGSPLNIGAERPTSAGTSGYSTDECSIKVICFIHC
jgi:hypothetical protein